MPPANPYAAFPLCPRTPSAAALHPGAEVVYFEHLTVHHDDLEAARATAEAVSPGRIGQWRLEYLRPGSRLALGDAQARSLAVAEKILLRGRITRLSEELESQLSSAPQQRRDPADLDASAAFELDPQSPGERIFLKLFADAAGPGWHEWIVPQFDLSAVQGPDGRVLVNGRADFLIVHPAINLPLIVEIDGPQHQGQALDKHRDAALRTARYAVFRIPTTGLDPSTNVDLGRLLAKLRAHQQACPSISNPRIERAGQIQAALLQGIFAGIIPAESGTPLSVSCDLLDDGQLTINDLQAILDDLAGLLRHCGELYGAPTLGPTLRVSSPGDIRVQFVPDDDPPVSGTLYLSGVTFPFPLAFPARLGKPAIPTSTSRPLLDWFLHRIFRKPSLYPEQYSAIARGLQGEDVVVLLPTGAGKSFAFQLTGLLLPGRTIVVAPITSLIRDQAMVLAAHGIDRVLPMTGGELPTVDARDAAHELVRQGDALFTYVAPERFQIQAFRDAVHAMTLSQPVGLVAIDEAHCVSEWGHDFRPAYLRIGRTTRDVGRRDGWTPPVMALTGTASRLVLRDLQRELDIHEFDALITPATFDRQEIEFAVRQCDSDAKESQLVAVLRHWLPGHFGVPADAFRAVRGSASYCGLIFCQFVKGEFGAASVAKKLTEQGMPTEVYAGSPPVGWKHGAWEVHKRAVEQRFKRNEVTRIACTKAFGMGIDKPNVRYTVHFGVPPSIEAFYQEAGRAGRNRERAISVILFSEFDTQRNSWLLAPAQPIEDVSRQLSGVSRSEGDDVTRALFFQKESFQGMTADRAEIGTLLERLGSLERRRTAALTYAEDGELREIEKTLHRLVVIGAVEDYTVNYSGKAVQLTISGRPIDQLLDGYLAYVRAYQVARANEERRRATERLSGSSAHDVHVRVLMDLYLQFVYDVIERGRRRGLNEMLEAARAGVASADAFRRRVLSYLEATQYSEALEAILEDPRAGMALVGGIVENIRAPSEAAELRGQVGRYLETYPDQPSLLFLRGITECLCRDTDLQAAQANFAAWLESSQGAYGLSFGELLPVIGLAMRRMPARHLEIATWLEELIITKWPSRNELRQMVREVGLPRASRAPWQLLLSALQQAQSTSTTARSA